MAVTLITVSGTFTEADGTPEVGKIFLISDIIIQSSSENAMVGPLNYEAELDEDGHFEVEVAATNDPDWAPLNFTYLVKEKLTNGTRTYRIAVPYDSAGAALNLADVSPVQDNPDPEMYVLISSANDLGGYPQIDPNTGKIPSSVIPAGGGDADGAFRGTWSAVTAYITGDTVIRSGAVYGAIQNSTNQDPATQAAYWTEYPTSVAPVTSVNGETGVVVLSAADVGADAAGSAAAALSAAEDYADAGDTALSTSFNTALAGKLAISIVNAKGDILVATGNDVITRLAVGTDGQVLTADSAEVTGVKWETPAGGGGGAITAMRQARISSGNFAFVNNGNNVWTPTAGVELSIPAEVGDYVDISASFAVLFDGGSFLDLAVIVGSTIVRYMSNDLADGADEGMIQLYPASSIKGYPGPMGFTVTADDLDGGNVRWVLAQMSTTGLGHVYANPGGHFFWRSINWGPSILP